MIFVDKTIAKKSFNNYFELLHMGRNGELAEYIGLKNILLADKNRTADYCLHQVNIIIHGEDEDEFQENVIRACSIFRDTGLVVVREDFNMARCFWSTLPGNFKFLCRTKYGATSHLANLSSVHDVNLGNNTGSKWGPPITLFKTEAGTPFYFNFHNNKNGNTLIIGPHNSGKTMTSKFLLTQSVKVDPNIIYIDMMGEAESFIKKMGGTYLSVTTDGDSPIKVFPFDDSLFHDQKDALREWIFESLLPTTESGIKNAKTFADTLIENLSSLPTPSERKEAFSAILEDVDKNKSVNSFAGIIKKETYTKLFNEDVLDPISSGNVVGINLSEIKKPILRNSFLKILLLKIEQLLTSNTATIIVVNNATNLLEVNSFSRLLQPWLEKLTNKNGLAILEIDNTKSVRSNPDLRTLISYFATQIYTTDPLADKTFKFAYNLEDWELRKIKTYTPESRMFLIKQDYISVMLSLYMDNLRELMEDAA